jgi:hypothetical protein
MGEVEGSFVRLSKLFDLHLVPVCFFEDGLIHNIKGEGTEPWLSPFVLIVEVGISHVHLNKLGVLFGALFPQNPPVFRGYEIGENLKSGPNLDLRAKHKDRVNLYLFFELFL